MTRPHSVASDQISLNQNLTSLQSASVNRPLSSSLHALRHILQGLVQLPRLSFNSLTRSTQSNSLTTSRRTPGKQASRNKVIIHLNKNLSPNRKNATTVGDAHNVPFHADLNKRTPVSFGIRPLENAGNNAATYASTQRAHLTVTELLKIQNRNSHYMTPSISIRIVSTLPSNGIL